MNTTRPWLHTAIILFAFSGAIPQNEVHAAGVSISGTGITFPDATYQNTAPFPPLPARMIWVATMDGDYTSPVAAMSDLATWCPSPSQTSPCVMRIAPGDYDLGNESLNTHDWVSVVGSGAEATILRGGGSPNRCLVNAEGTAGQAQLVLKDLAVIGTQNSVSGDACAIGPQDEVSVTMRLERVSAYATSSNASLAINAWGRPSLTQVSAWADGASGTDTTGIVLVTDGACELSDVSATGADGSGSNVGITGAFFDASTNLSDVTAYARGGTNAVGMLLSNYVTEGAWINHISATAESASSSNDGIHFVASYGVMTNVHATTSGGTQSTALIVEDSILTLIGGTATAKNGSTNRGIYTKFTTWNVGNNPVIEDVIATATGASGSTNHGIYNLNSAGSFKKITALASGGTTNYGIYNNTSTPVIQGSHLLRCLTAPCNIAIRIHPQIDAVQHGRTWILDTLVEGTIVDDDENPNCHGVHQLYLVTDWDC